MRITLIVAAARNGVIASGGGIPWHLPDDFRFFKRTTMGHTMIMGRKTFESIGRPLPGRRSVVVTRSRAWTAEGVDVARGLDDALEAARVRGEGEVFVIGGGQLFRQTLPLASRVHLTRVDAEPEGEVTFAELDDTWTRVDAVPHEPDSLHAHGFVIETWERPFPPEDRPKATITG